MTRAVLERRILVPVLVGYVALLVLAAWRHEIRPAVLDRAVDFARGTLGFVGIRPGVAVFTVDSGSAPDAKIVAICLEVRSSTDRGVGRRVYLAADATCPAQPPRMWVRGEEIFLDRSVVGLRAAAARRRAGDSDLERARFAKLLAQSIAAHFVGRDRLAGAAADRYALLWREARVSYRTRARSDRVVALISWRSASDPRLRVAWQPDDATLREHGWSNPEKP